MTDPGEDISDALVAYVNGLKTQTPNPLDPITCNAENPEDPSGKLELEHETIQVFFFPSGDEEEKIGRGGEVVETIVVSMLVVRQLSPEFTRRRLNAFTRAVRHLIRGERMAGYVYSFAEVVSKFDPEAIHERKQFVSAAKLYYMRATGK